LLSSRAFYEKLGFTVFGGNQEQRWLIMKSGTTLMGTQSWLTSTCRVSGNHPESRTGINQVISKVVAIFTTAESGTALQPIAEASLESGKGLVGDRYYKGTGTFSDKLKSSQDWEITLIESEEIERFNGLGKSAFSPGEFRRNILTSGIRLNELVGRRFSVGSTVLEGIRLCEPCAYLAKFLGPASAKALAHRAGLRARILTGGVVRPGDPIEELNA
jgi:MOSC domain-containing protein YiiM